MELDQIGYDIELLKDQIETQNINKEDRKNNLQDTKKLISDLKEKIKKMEGS
jgi:hypothetical protein